MIRSLRAALKTVGLRLRSEGGFTIPELTVAIGVSAIIAVSAMAFVVISSRQYEDQQDRVWQTDDARNALLAITSELRDAPSVQLVDARTVDATVRLSDGTTETVRFACAPVSGGLSECTRTVISTGASEKLVGGVTNADNFSNLTGSDLTGTVSLNGALRINLDVDLTNVTNSQNPVNLVATVKPRNCVASPAAGVLNPPC